MLHGWGFVNRDRASPISVLYTGVYNVHVTSKLKLLGQLLTPSWLSGLISVTASLAIVITSVAIMHYNGSSIQFLRQTESSKQSLIAQNSDTVDSNLEDSWFISDIPLLVFWAGIGLLVYLLLIQIVRAFTRVIDLEHSLDYVHVNRQQLIRQALLKFAARAVILVIWFLYIQFTIHVLIPYVVALAYAASGELGWLTDAVYLLVATLLMIITIHIHTVMLRLLLLRPRAIGEAV